MIGHIAAIFVTLLMILPALYSMHLGFVKLVVWVVCTFFAAMFAGELCDQVEDHRA